MDKNLKLSFSHEEFPGGVRVFNNQETRVKAFSLSSNEFVRCPDGVFLFKEIVVFFNVVICKVINGDQDNYRIYLLAERRWLVNEEKEKSELNFAEVIYATDDFIHVACGKSDRVYVFDLEDWITIPKSEVNDFEKVEIGFFNQEKALLLISKRKTNSQSIFLLNKNKLFHISWKGQEFFEFQKVFNRYIVMAFCENDTEKVSFENVFILSEKKMFSLPKKYTSTNFLGSLYGDDYIVVRTNRFVEDKPIFKILSTSTWKLESLKIDFSEIVSEIISPAIENRKIVFSLAPSPKKISI
jgi:hypothetical protein